MKLARKRSWGDRIWQFDTVNITSGSRLQARLEATAVDVVLFQEQKWTAPRPPEQRSRIRKKEWNVTLLLALQSVRAFPAVEPALHAVRASLLPELDESCGSGQVDRSPCHPAWMRDWRACQGQRRYVFATMTATNRSCRCAR